VDEALSKIKAPPDVRRVLIEESINHIELLCDGTS